MSNYPGQKVTPINDEPWVWTSRHHAAEEGGDPVYGKVYRINKIDYIKDGGRSIRAFSFFECHPDVYYEAALFRPVCDRPTSIEVFAKQRKPQRVGA